MNQGVITADGIVYATNMEGAREIANKLPVPTRKPKAIVVFPDGTDESEMDRVIARISKALEPMANP